MVERRTNIPNMLGIDWFRVVLEGALTKCFIYGSAILFGKVIFGDIKGFKVAGVGERAQRAPVGLGKAQAPDGRFRIKHIFELKRGCCLGRIWGVH